MKNALKKNPALFIGLALPVLMILIFAGIPFISSFMVPPPKYNFIYSFNNYGSDGKLKVVDGKLILQVHNSWRESRQIQQILYLIDVGSKKSIKLNLLPSKDELSLIPPLETREFIVEGVSLKALDPSNISPDGYEVRTTYNDNFFSLLFFFGDNRQNRLSIKKSGRTESFSNPAYGYGGKFEGWVIPQ